MAKTDALSCSLSWLQWLARCRRDLVGSPRRRAARAKGSPTESLELRSLLTTFTVTSLADSGSGSLRQAILDANSNAGDDEIVFQSGLNGTISLTSGQMMISETVEITGNGAANSIIDAQGASRIFEISSGAVSLTGLTFQNGQTTANNVNYADNTNNGGAIKSLSSGTLTISGSTLSGNATLGGGAHGGAIFSDTGAIVINESVLSGNRTTGDGAYGGALFCRSGEVTITRSTLSGNLTEGASSDGGAIFIANGSVSIKQSTLSANSTTDVFADGGAVFARNNSVVLSQSTISGNSVQGNGSQGGAIFSGYGTVTVSQSTLTLNSSTQNAGGGIFSNSGSISIRNSIVAGNTDNGTAPDVQRSLNVGDTLTVESSLIGRNNGTAFTTTGLINPDVNGNWIGGNTPGTAVSPMLAALADNGSSTMTHALLENSPAFNAGSSLLAVDVLDNDAPLTTDQRGAGFSRFQFGRPDMGAFESTTLDSPDGTTSGDAFVLTYSSTSTTGNVVVTISTNGGPVRELGTFPMSALLNLDGKGGSDSARVVGTSMSDTIVVGNSGLTVNGASLVFSSIENRTLAGAAGDDEYRFDADASLGLFTLDESSGGTDTLSFSSTTTSGVTVKLAVGGTQIVNTNLSLALGSGPTFENVTGGTMNDTLVGNSLSNVLRGNGGHDTVNGAAGSDTLIGGAGDDLYVFAAAASNEIDAVTELPSQGTDTLSFSALTTDVVLKLNLTTPQTVHTNRTVTLSSGSAFENATGGSGNDTLAGNALVNILRGNAGNDSLNGATGSDSLFGGIGDDLYAFGAAAPGEVDVVAELPSQGTDTLTFSSLTTGVAMRLNLSTPQIVHTNRTITLSSGSAFENVTGGSGNDTFVGNSLANVLRGNAGNDALNGAAGNDTLFGGTDNDLYTFGVATSAEADVVGEVPSHGTDTLTFSSLSADVSLKLSLTTAQVVHSNRTLSLSSGTAFENVIGGSGNDMLIGNSLRNDLRGLSGNDILIGHGEDDQLLGGAGRDILIGGLGIDLIVGDSGDDIAIAGRTTNDNSSNALSALRSEWTSGKSYAARIANLRAGVGNPVVSLKATINVLNDSGEDDTLTGGTGMDWYFRAIDDAVTDLFAAETIDAI